MLTVENLGKEFTVHQLGGRRLLGCAEVNFRIGPGRALALSGHSGAGKSSILKCIYRTYLPTSGRIIYQSTAWGPVDLAGLPEARILELRRREIGYVTQFLRVVPRVPAVEVVAEPLLNAGQPADQARAVAAELLLRLNLPPALLDAYPVNFSGGEQQRVNIARAVIARPRLLLLDEPTASLDQDAVSRVSELLRDLRRQGTTMVMIFHDPQLMRLLADEIYELAPRETADVCA